jgi:hypothetical protein
MEITVLWTNEFALLGPFLGNEGINMLDAWLNTGMSTPVEITSVVVPLGAITGVPGEADPLLASFNSLTGDIDLSYTPACDAAEHNIYFGDLAAVSSYAYSGVVCSVGTSGNVAFDPGSGNIFFLIVANDGVKEGSYGTNSTDDQRPEDVGTPVCDRERDLDGVVCE